MPFPKWAVEPVFLGRAPLPPDKVPVGPGTLEAVVNVQLAGCVRQLSSLAELAAVLFGELGAECRTVTERSERLSQRISAVQEVVDGLNARAVTVPVSDLRRTVEQLHDQRPFTTKYEQKTQLFLPSNRPPCVDRLYSGAATSPVAVMCTMDRYRTDGLSASDLFMVTPVLGAGQKKRAKHKKYLDIETRKPANFSLANKSKQGTMEYGTSSLPPLVSPSTSFTLKQNENMELERLPSPEEQAMMVSLEYPSCVVPIDTTGSSFNRMSLLRRSLIHADFIIKRKKNKKKSKRRHTFCEGQNREIEQAIRNVTNSSCQTDDFLDTSASCSATIQRTLSKRRSRSAMDNSRRKTLLEELDLDTSQQESKDSATEDDKEKTPTKTNTFSKKSKTSSQRSRSFNPISSLSAAISIAAVKMRNSTRGFGTKQDDGRSSSGNWSASSSTRASVDSDHQHTVSPVDGVSSPSRNSVGKDSVLSDVTHQDQYNRSRDEALLIQSLAHSPIKRKKFGALNLPWEPNSGNGRISNTPTPDITSQCSSNTPLVRSPYAGRRGMSDDGDSSVYSVDTDGYYTSMHTDSGLWCNALNNVKNDGLPNTDGFRERQESQSSVSTLGNSSINSFLSKSATECSSNSGSFKERSGPDPPPRISSVKSNIQSQTEIPNKDQDADSSVKSESPNHQNGSTSDSDHDVRDRILAKTVISANRYPSMCAVSPETSDDEINNLKSKTAANVNVIIAEVHREEKSSDTNKPQKTLDLISQTTNKGLSDSNYSQPLSIVCSSSVNMYRSETPLPSNFSPASIQNNPISTSTPRPGSNITTFSPDLSDISKNRKHDSKFAYSDSDSKFDSEEEGSRSSPTVSYQEPNKSLIPLKYAQRITVTPIARTESPTGTIKRTPIKALLSNTKATQPDKPFAPINLPDSQSSYISFQSPDSPVSSIPNFNKEFKDNNPYHTSSLPRPIARVTLDPSGKVVYSSNSLGRNMNISKSNDQRNCATLPTYHGNSESKNLNEGNVCDEKKILSIKELQENSETHTSSNVSQELNTKCELTSKVPNAQQNQQFSSTNIQTQNSAPKSASFNRDFNFRPSRGGRFCRSYFPSHLISPPSTSADNRFIKSSGPALQPDALQKNSAKSANTENSGLQLPNSFSQNSNKYVYSKPIPQNNYPPRSVPNSQTFLNSYSKQDTNCSSVWPSRLSYSPEKKYMSNINKSSNSVSNQLQASAVSLRPPDLIPSGESPPSTLDITSPASSQKKFSPISLTLKDNKSTSDSKNQQNLKSLSATELFAIIHSSKKKHNIKTESELSLSPLSSRSVSPALSQSSVTKLQPIETGILSKRDSYCDKTKWCNSMPPNLRKQTPEKLSAKPTSMHDFKMLLLQARTGNGSSPRPSAAELLKVSPPRNSPVPQGNATKLPVPSPSYKPVSSYSSPNTHYSPTHGTLPAKRSSRTRSPYLTRYDSAYPPIMEDCSEELESSHEDNKCLYRSSSSSQNPVYKMPDAVPQSSPMVKATSTWV